MPEDLIVAEGIEETFEPPRRRTNGTAIRIAAAAVFIAVLPHALPNDFRVYTAVLAGVYLIAAIGLNVVQGYAGVISLGTSAFATIGAYGAAIAHTRWGWSYPGGMALGVVVATALGIVTAMPALRLGTFAVAVVTLAYGGVTSSLILYWPSFTGGGEGVAAKASTLSLTELWYIVAGLGVLCWVAQRNLVVSPLGRGWEVGRLSPILAQSLGVAVARTKVVAFAMAAALAGLAGSLWPVLNGRTDTDTFGLDYSVLVLLMVVIGGEGRLWGPVWGVAILTGIPVVLNEAFSQGGKVSQLVYGIVLLGTVLVLRGGVSTGFDRVLARVRPRTHARGVAAAGQAAIGATTPGATVDLDLLDAVGDPLPLHVREITVTFGAVRALVGVSLTVRPGTVHGLIGPNGSGKTTLLNRISGFLGSQAGEVRLGERRLGGAPYRRARRGLARTFQQPLLLEAATALDNVYIGLDAHRRASFVSYLFRLPTARREASENRRKAAAWLRSVGLHGAADARAEELPPGMRRQLEIARALAASPRILLMDEPAAGLTNTEIDTLEALVRAAAAKGVGVVLIEHHADLVMRLCDEITVLDRGHLIAHGTPAEIRNDPTVIDAYLGATPEQHAVSVDDER
jgi:ABC-type branched-subunit amino acid transport system ATPase component/ABC-type branched-subunit amino acid transport system permease subunit